MSSVPSSSSHRHKACVSRGHELVPSPEPIPSAATSLMKRRLESVVSSNDMSLDPRPYKHSHRLRGGGEILPTIQSDPIEPPSLLDLDPYCPPHLVTSPSGSPTPVAPIRALKPSRTLPHHTCDATTRLGLVLRSTQETINNLRQELVKEKQAQQQRELKLKQDMMLDILKHQEQSKKLLEHADRKENQFQRLAAHHKHHVEKLEHDVKDERAKLLKALGEVAVWRNDAEHMTALYKTLEEDLDELRRLENEERANRMDRVKGKDLPPAYGSLDDEERMAPYQSHANDGGALEVATLKRTIRDNFMLGVVRAQVVLDDLRKPATPQARETMGATAFRMMTLDLRTAANNITEILQHAHDVTCKTIIASGGVTDPDALPTVRRVTAKDWYIADRCAQLLLDLSLRMLSALEIRPTPIHLFGAEKSRTALAWSAIDDTLTNILEKVFKGISGPSRLLEMQLYLTQTTMLQERFTSLRTGMNGTFEKTLLWLTDHVEVERQLAAMCPATEADVASENMDEVPEFGRLGSQTLSDYARAEMTGQIDRPM